MLFKEGIERYNPMIGLSEYSLKKDKSISKEQMPISYKSYKKFLYDSMALEYRIEIIHVHGKVIHYNNKYKKEEYLKTVNSYYMLMDYVARSYKLNIRSIKIDKDSILFLDKMLNDSLSKYVKNFKIFEGNHPNRKDLLKINKSIEPHQYAVSPLVIIELK